MHTAQTLLISETKIAGSGPSKKIKETAIAAVVHATQYNHPLYINTSYEEETPLAILFSSSTSVFSLTTTFNSFLAQLSKLKRPLCRI